MTDSCTVKIRLIALGLVLIFCNVLCVAWFLLMKTWPLKITVLPPEGMPHVLGNLSYKAYGFFKAHRSQNKSDVCKPGPVKLEHGEDSRGMSLETGTWIRVTSDGYYLVFAQSVFMLSEIKKCPEEEDAEQVYLRLDLTISHPGEKDSDVVAAWEERAIQRARSQFEWTAKMSFLVLMELREGQRVGLKAKHREMLSYDPPLSTFITVVKYCC